MWLCLLLPCLLVLSTQAAFSTPIRWGGRLNKNFVVAPNVLPKGAWSNDETFNPVPKLMIWDQLGETSPSKIAHFTARSDKTITLDGSGFCVEADENRGVARINPCSAAPTQLWNVVPRGGGRMNQIQLQGTKKCLDVRDDRGDLNGAQVELKECGITATEAWWFDEPVPDSPLSMQHVVSSILVVAGLGALSLSIWFAKWKKNRSAVTNLDSVPPIPELDGVCLTIPLASRQSCTPLTLNASLDARAEKTIPAVLAIDPESSNFREKAQELGYEWDALDETDKYLLATKVVERPKTKRTDAIHQARAYIEYLQQRGMPPRRDVQKRLDDLLAGKEIHGVQSADDGNVTEERTEPSQEQQEQQQRREKAWDDIWALNNPSEVWNDMLAQHKAGVYSQDQQRQEQQHQEQQRVELKDQQRQEHQHQEQQRVEQQRMVQQREELQRQEQHGQEQQHQNQKRLGDSVVLFGAAKDMVEEQQSQAVAMEAIPAEEKLVDRTAQADEPGLYTIVVPASVGDGKSTKSTAVGGLSTDTLVHVVEVATVQEENRVRGRIESPPGWISLLNTESGVRLATKAEDKIIVQDDAPLPQYSVHNGYISGGGDLSHGEMTVAEALRLSKEFKGQCLGFCHYGPATTEPVQIYFKSKWDLQVHPTVQWTSYCINQASAPAPPAPPPAPPAPAPALPKDWTEHIDPASGKTFYNNSVTGESTWQKPQEQQRLETTRQEREVLTEQQVHLEAQQMEQQGLEQQRLEQERLEEVERRWLQQQQLEQQSKQELLEQQRIEQQRQEQEARRRIMAAQQSDAPPGAGYSVAAEAPATTAVPSPATPPPAVQPPVGPSTVVSQGGVQSSGSYFDMFSAPAPAAAPPAPTPPPVQPPVAPASVASQGGVQSSASYLVMGSASAIAATPPAPAPAPKAAEPPSETRPPLADKPVDGLRQRPGRSQAGPSTDVIEELLSSRPESIEDLRSKAREMIAERRQAPLEMPSQEKYLWTALGAETENVTGRFGTLKAGDVVSPAQLKKFKETATLQSALTLRLMTKASQRANEINMQIVLERTEEVVQVVPDNVALDEAPVVVSSTIAFIADKECANGKRLLELLKNCTNLKWVMGNCLADFEASEKLKDVSVIVPVAFADGNLTLLSELWPLCPQLKWVHSMAAGVEGIVPQMMALPGGADIPLTNAKGAFSRSLAEYALGAILHFNKQVPRLQENKESRKWEKFIMNELHGSTVGFVGFGDIAQTTADYCRMFGMNVIALRQSVNADGNDVADKVYYTGAEVNPEQDQKLNVFREADYVVCSLPGGESTEHFCGKDEFAAMKPTGVFISVGRGSCVDEAALAEALTSGKIAGAALDVFEQEPLPLDSPLWTCPNTLLSSHNADWTPTYMELTWDLFLSKLSLFSAPSFIGFDAEVNKSKGY